MSSSDIILCLVGGIVFGWSVSSALREWRNRPPVVRGSDGHWRAQRGVRR